MVEKIRLELPAHDVIESPVTQIQGWCTTDSPDTKLSLWVNDNLILHEPTERRDVQRVFPGVPSFGFTHWLTPENCVQARDSDLVLRMQLGQIVEEKRLKYSPAARRTAVEWEDKKAAKRAWCMAALRCPVCRQGRPVADSTRVLACSQCGTHFDQGTSALNLLPDELYRRFQLKPTGNVSAHRYSPVIDELIEEVRRAGGKVLDCGAGLRSLQDDVVINMEIVDYGSTDILAVGQSLPFADASFDLVLSLAVLEHVDDPWTCAAELVRVVKPGGKIYCVVPFLQPEHGYPNHFYNMTRQGLAQLFVGKARLVSHEVPRFGAPIYTLCWFINEYMANLPAEQRAEFEQLTIGDLARLRKDDYWDKAYVRQLNAEGNWRLASVTAALLVRDE